MFDKIAQDAFMKKIAMSAKLLAGPMSKAFKISTEEAAKGLAGSTKAAIPGLIQHIRAASKAGAPRWKNPFIQRAM